MYQFLTSFFTYFFTSFFISFFIAFIFNYDYGNNKQRDYIKITIQFINKMRRQDRASYKSPRRELLNSELEEHSNKIKDLLRQDLNMLEEENAILKAKCKKVGELQERVEIVLRQNSDLLAQNQKLSKLLHQKKSEIQVMKNKFDSTMAHRLGTSAEHEFERKKLLTQIDHLRNQIQQIDRTRLSQIGQIKAQHQVELQGLKRQNVTGQEIYEQQIRKLREQLEKRQFDNSDNLNRLKRLASESEYEILRLKEEKQKLRNQLLYLQAERKKDMESLKHKLEMNYIEEMEALKKNHISSLDSLQIENARLREYLDAKNREVEDLSNKNGKQKGNFEQTISLLRKQNESIRMKMLEGERFTELEIDNLKGKLHEMHEAEIQQMKINHQRFVECLQVQMKKLEAGLRSKNDQIQQLIKQKTSVRQMFQTESGRLKEQIESLLLKIRDTEARIKQIEEKYEIRLKQKEEHIQYLDQLNSDQRQNADKEQSALRQIIDHQKNELEKEKMSFKQKEQALKESLSEYKNESETLKDELRREKVDKERKVEELKNELDSTVTQLQTKVDTTGTKTAIMERQAESLKKTIDLKDKQVRSLQERVRSSDDRERKLEKQIEDLRMKIVKKDQKSNEMLQQQKQRLQNSFSYTFQNMRSDHDSAIKLQQSKLSDANEKLRKKQRELEDLLRAYKKMREELEVLTEQEANKKDLTLKFPGATADLIATKNLFDVYLKTKVLDVCGDALEKENMR